MLRIFFYFIFYLMVSSSVSYCANADIFKIESIDHVYGSDKAPITVFEYSSLTCIHCAKFHLDVFPKIKEFFIDTNKVRWVRRNFASDKSALAGSILLNCVDKAVKEKYLKILFSEQSTWAYSKNYQDILDNMVALGKQNTEKYKHCAKDKNLENQILQTRFKVRSIIDSTPAFLIDGKRNENLYSYNSFEKLFNQLLNQGTHKTFNLQQQSPETKKN